MKQIFLIACSMSLVIAALFVAAGRSDSQELYTLIIALVLFLSLIAFLLAFHRHKSRRSIDGKPDVILDGSNIMHWRGGKADLAAVKDVLHELRETGVIAGVVFDANAGYKLSGRYLHHHEFARKLDLPQDHVMVVNKGEAADGLILRAAQDFGAKVVSNDRFRDWAESFPLVRKPGFLISGRYKSGVLHLDL